RHGALGTAALVTAGIALSGCAGPDGDTTRADGADEVTVTNCEQETTFPAPAERIYVNESQMLSNLFALDADEQITAVTGLPPGKQDMMKEIYGDDRIDALPVESDDYATLENVLAASPDAMMAGFGWGYSREDNLTPDTLADHDIPAYVSSPPCLHDSGSDGGIMPQWEAVRTDTDHVGKITGREEAARETRQDLESRLGALRSATEPGTAPTVFFFALSGKSVMSGGKFSPAQAVINAAAGDNA